jgi:hypothetical protein
MDLVTFTKLIINLATKAKLQPEIFFPIKKVTWPWKHNKIWYKAQWHGKIKVSRGIEILGNNRRHGNHEEI